MQFTFRPLQWNDAKRIITWHYEEPYTLYTRNALEFQIYFRLRVLWRWLEHDYFAVDDEHGSLVGFFRFSKLLRPTVDIGLALRPDLTGCGHGLAFVEAGLAFGIQRYAPAHFALTVAAFNHRALTVYTRAGFRVVRTVTKHTSEGVGSSYEMRRDVERHPLSQLEAR